MRNVPPKVRFVILASCWFCRGLLAIVGAGSALCAAMDVLAVAASVWVGQLFYTADVREPSDRVGLLPLIPAVSLLIFDVRALFH